MNGIGSIARQPPGRRADFHLLQDILRTNKLCGTVLYGVVLGFVVYLTEELVNRSGSPASAIPRLWLWAACVAIVIGLTVLLYRKDRRA
jgi:hypothetical protein